jgi:hypothetical protein
MKGGCPPGNQPPAGVAGKSVIVVESIVHAFHFLALDLVSLLKGRHAGAASAAGAARTAVDLLAAPARL